MIIRKEFKVEFGHIVRNCSSDRCKYSQHGHSAKIEVFFTADKLDNAEMIMDFGLMKTNIKQYIDSFDHTYVYWDKEPEDFINYVHKYSARWISLPFSPSAEALSIFFFKAINNIVDHTTFNNGEGNIQIKSVRFHETDTGYAEAFEEDENLIFFNLYDVKFSEDVKQDWDLDLSNPEQLFYNPTVKQQII